ncbi:MAG: hypothetical protein AB1643_00920 [Patescibacteria group bacterium]
MIKIIPAINADNFEEIKEKIKLLESIKLVDWIQLDVADGTLTKNTIWHNSSDLLNLKTNLNIEVHLMINDIERRVEDWLLPNVKRVIFHIEKCKDPDFVIKRLREACKEIGVAIGPETSWTKLSPFKNRADIFQILGVKPGLPGQKIQEETFEKIKNLREHCRLCIIEVDGGVNKENAKRVVDAGANILVAATAIFSSMEANIKDNIKNLYGSLE